jgi:hypothetical protein
MGDRAGKGGRESQCPDGESGPQGEPLDRVEKSFEPVPHATKLRRPVLACRDPPNLSRRSLVDFFRDIRNNSTTPSNSPPSSPVFRPGDPVDR